MVERDRVLLLPLLLAAEPLQVFGQLRHLEIEIFEQALGAIELLLFRRMLRGDFAQFALQASGPLPVFLPPLTAWP